MAKDYIKFYLLNEVVNLKSAKFHLYLESEGIVRDFLDIKTDKAVYRFNNFNVSEDGINNCITFRPIVVGCYSYFEIEGQLPIKVEIIRNGTGTVEKAFTMMPGKTKIVFEPDGIKKYLLKVEQNAQIVQNAKIVQNAMYGQQEGQQQATLQTQNLTSEDNISMKQDRLHNLENQRRDLRLGNDRISEEINKINEEILQLEERKRQLTENKNNLQTHMDRLQEEYEKDYAQFESDAEDIRARYTVDEEIIRMYAGKDVKPIEELLMQAENLIENIEQQIKNFVMVQQKKTSDIEEELKIGKKE